MENTFKHFLTLVMLLIVSSTSLYASEPTDLLFDTTSYKSTIKNATATNLLENDSTIYSQNILLNNQLIKEGFYGEIEEEEQHLKHFNCKKTNSLNKWMVSNFNQHFFTILERSNQSPRYNYSIFFHSKTASSLYLLFEVFRI